MFALVDCNNFYVSCERVFDPTLIGKPVIVLSNNDGCAISRSDEAKTLGIQMGTPPHLIKDLIRKQGIKMFSSNYTLYGDMSDRVMKILADFVPAMELYSIDEAFLDMTSMPYCDLLQLGMDIRNKVVKSTGIPVCVGIAATKALAKMANRYAKKRNKALGVHWAANQALVDEMLAFTAVEDVWGIGRQHALMLNRNNIKNALQFKNAPEDFVRTTMSVVGLRLQAELKGQPAFAVEDKRPLKKNICTGRSFAALTQDKKLVIEAVSNFAANCALKLRKQKTIARELKVSINTNPHRLQDSQLFRSVVIQMEVATNNTPEIIKYALKGLDIIFRPGYNFMKCSVEVKNLVPEDTEQLNMFSKRKPKQDHHLLATLDKVNLSLGKDLVRFGVQGFEKNYKARAAHISPKYTTRLADIIRIR